ncbi:CvfB family protein [Lactobacillus selangorensis]|nr:S1-like domain-containing RNA-binding protein [Lactobacillus selangorensis]
MNPDLGQTITGKIIDENDKAYFVQKEGRTYQMNKVTLTSDQQKLQKGDNVTGFAYENEKHQLIITMNTPHIGFNHFGLGEVVETRHDLGVFVNIGLPDKDIVVSMDDLPLMSSVWPHRGDHLRIALRVDKKGRLWGIPADANYYQKRAKTATEDMKNADIVGLVYQTKKAGTYVVTKDHYLGFIHPSERDGEPRLGETVKARVIGLHPDGSLNLSLRPRAYEVISDDAAMVLAILIRTPGHTMNYDDKSAPEKIKAYFGISKSAFKRALGHLLKQRLIIEADGKTSLTDAGVERANALNEADTDDQD